MSGRGVVGGQVAQQGLTWGVLGESITPDYPFSARNVFIVVAADIVIYALLTAYLDQVPVLSVFSPYGTFHCIYKTS